MKFIDELVISVKAGNGGDGFSSFTKEYRMRKGTADGGNGGSGGSIIFEGDQSINSFFEISNKRFWKAKNGGNGGKRLRSGKKAEDVLIKVPLGTIIFIKGKEKKENILLSEIMDHGQKKVVANGGNGGKGNASFLSSVNRSPKSFQKGKEGEKYILYLELRNVADIGLVGSPSVGKSTILNSITNCQVKTGDYYFTTLYPQLGALVRNEKRIIIADLPGIIEDSWKNKGLGIRFLKHISRCKAIAFVLDIEKENSFSDMKMIKKQLKNFYSDNFIKEKSFLTIYNKIDLVKKDVIEKFRKKDKEAVFISSLKNINLDDLINTFFKKIENISCELSKNRKDNYKIYDFTNLFEKKEKRN